MEAAGGSKNSKREKHNSTELHSYRQLLRQKNGRSLKQCITLPEFALMQWSYWKKQQRSQNKVYHALLHWCSDCNNQYDPLLGRIKAFKNLQK